MNTMANDTSARENWARYQYGKDRGHIEYTERAELCERMYMGGGEQWSDADKEILQKFIGNSEIKPLEANNAEMLVKYVRWVSTVVLNSASSPASQVGDEMKSGTNVPIPSIPDDFVKGDDVW